ncbi:MAG: hypothetical protein PHE55_17165 [Methylococcaceae bacterium]|nr:hypothetical protein [Methylococcaceae bacterium]
METGFREMLTDDREVITGDHAVKASARYMATGDHLLETREHDAIIYA